MAILPGSTTSWTRNPPEECSFRQELPNYLLRDEESTGGMIEMDSAGNYQLIYVDPDR
jgi:hypothetical protein